MLGFKITYIPYGNFIRPDPLPRRSKFFVAREYSLRNLTYIAAEQVFVHESQKIMQAISCARLLIAAC